MRKVHIVIALAIALLSISACAPKEYFVNLSYVSEPLQYNFVSTNTIRYGDSLKAIYPDDDFVYKNWKVTYTFDVSSDTKDEEPESKKERRIKHDNEVRSNFLNNSGLIDLELFHTTRKRIDAEKIDEIIKSHIPVKSNWEKTKVTIAEKNEINVVALDDELNYDHVIFYNNTNSVSEVGSQYSNVYYTKFIPTITTKNYQDDGIFHSDAKLAIMSIPTFVQGNSVQLDYTINYCDYKYLTTIFFPENYFIEDKTVSFEIPEGLDVELIEMNFDGYDITRSEGAISAPIKNTDANSDKKKKKKSKKSTENDNDVLPPSNIKTINYRIKNIPAFKHESYNYGLTHSAPHVLVLCKSYTNGAETINMMKNTDELYKWYSSLAKKVDNKNSELKTLTQKITADKTTDEDKISTIFYWVQDNIRYIAFEDGLAGFVPDNCQNVFNNLYGDCKGMANLTKEMLKSIGYDARLTWIGTDRIAYDGTIPSLSTANHMICVVYPDSTDKTKKYFLDGTEKFIALGDYAKRIQGRTVIIEDGNKYIVDSVPTFDFYHNKIAKTETYSIVGKLLQGKAKKVYNGESKTNIIRSYANLQLNKRERALRSSLNNNDFNISVSGITHSNFNDRTTPFEIAYDITAKNRIIENGNTLYINPELDREWANAHIDTGRLSHFSFLFKKHTEKTTTINIPDGYKVLKLPPPVTIKNDYFIFNLSYKQQGNTILYSKEISMPLGYLHRKEISKWNDAIEKLTAFYDNYIILTK
jgi:hypothetical protein